MLFKRAPFLLALATALLAGPIASAERIPSVDGPYYADAPVQVGENGPPECPAIATVKGGKLSFDFQAASRPPLKYGTITVALDAAGQFHGKATLPAHGKLAPSYDDEEMKARYRDLKEVQLDVDTIEIGGGGTGLILKVTVPTGQGDGNYCQRTLEHAPDKRPSGGAFAGSYWLSSGTGKGWAIVCPAEATIAGGKLYMTALNRYSSWAVNGTPLGKDGSFVANTGFAKMPPDAELSAVGYYDDVIKQVHGVQAIHVKGGIKKVRATASGQLGQEIDLKAEDGDGFYNAGCSYYSDGFDVGGGFINCEKLSAAERKRHPVCH